MENYKWELSYGSSRKKIIWVSAYKKMGEFKDKEGRVLMNTYQLASIEINPIDKQNRIVWVVENKDFEVSIKLSESEEQELINLAYEFAKEKGYIDRIIKRCSK